MSEKRRTNRRRFLRTTGLASTGALIGLAGCTGGDGGDGGDGSSGSGQYPGNETLRNEFELPEFGFELEDELNVFQWTAYWPEGTVQRFEEAYDVSVNVSNYASNEELFNKLKAGGTSQFDLIFPSDYMLNIMANQELVQPLDKQKIPQWENLESFWVDNAPYDPGSERYSAPYFWGTSGIAWNQTTFDDSVRSELPFASWDALWDERFAGQMRMLDDVRETMGASLKRLGYSLNTKDEDEIMEAKEALINQKELLKTYSSTALAESLINANASPMHTWSGAPFQAYWELYEDGSSPIGYRVPEEGSVVWVDTAAVTKDAQNPNAAHAFINYVLNAQVNADIANWLFYPSPNEAAKEFINQDMLDNERIYPPDSTFEQLEFIRNLGDTTTLYSEAWTEVKNA